MDKELAYGTSLIRYQQQYEDRKDLAIEVYPDGNVFVKAPNGADEDQILDRLHRRAGWILKQQRYFEQMRQTPGAREYVSGEGYRYLGRQYRLKVNVGEPEGVERVGGHIRVMVKEKSPQRVQKLIESWFRNQAKAKFMERLTLCLKYFAGQVQTMPAIGVRKMPGRWGSCTPNGKILLNPSLVQAPAYCIDYVITHELAHLVEHNHGPGFYRLLDQVMPDWKERKHQLEQIKFD